MMVCRLVTIFLQRGDLLGCLFGPQKSLAQNIGQPSLISLAYTIKRSRKAYYGELETNQRKLDIIERLIYSTSCKPFSMRSRRLSRALRFISARQSSMNGSATSSTIAKAISRMFREGIEGFKGGLSAENYISITGASRATATKDLHDMVEKGAMNRSGERRHTRYTLNLPEPE
ncbi:Fic family protein [Rhizobium leucaenae]|nr:Fic family protein [Rhizobium leucaenae]